MRQGLVWRVMVGYGGAGMAGCGAVRQGVALLGLAGKVCK